MLKASAIRIVVENHPYPLLNDEDVNMLMSVLPDEEIERVGLCPDIGAMGEGLWEPYLERMLPRSFHCHVKPVVTGDAMVTISDYAPRMRQLLDRFNFQGAISFEHTEFRTMEEDPMRETRKSIRMLAAAFDVTLETAEHQQEFRMLGEITINNEMDITPTLEVRQFLADGCQTRMDAAVAIHDFATNSTTYSQGSSHSPRTKECSITSFCSLVHAHEASRKQCEVFHIQKIQRIRSGLQSTAEICICPMGLMVQSVPVRDNDRTYGLATCGAWLELGTEGMVQDSIRQFGGDCANQLRMGKAALAVQPYKLEKLLETRRQLQSLAGELASLYSRTRKDKAHTSQVREIIKILRNDEQNGYDHFVKFLPTHFERCLGLLPPGALALYQLNGEGMTSSWKLNVSAGFDAIPSQINRGEWDEMEVTNWQKHLVPNVQFIHLDHEDIVIYSSNIEIELWGYNLLEQFAAEVTHSLKSLRQNAEILSNRQLKIFVGRTKHAITTPLQGAASELMDLEFSLKARPGLEREKQYLRDALLYFADVNRIVANFASSLSSDASQFHEEYCFESRDLVRIVTECAQEHVSYARRREILIKAPNEIGQVIVVCDDTRIRELFDNLLQNAVKFADTQSTVEIKIRQVFSREADWRLEGPGVIVQVVNTGIGIPEKDIERIFTRYYQANIGASKRVIPGIGLGLAICKDIVNAHSGEIFATCVPTYYQRHLPDAERLQKMCNVVFNVQLPINKP